MFRALWIKQWVQLRTLRWVGFGLCLAMPMFLWTGAAAGKRGWFPFTITDYSLSTLFGEALPAFSALLWGLLAVMFAAQTFAGDRADQTERFLLERPVPRARAWSVRGLASLVSALVIALSNTVYLLAIARLVDDGSIAGLYSNILTLCSVGLGFVVLGTLGGMAAGEMVRTPMQAVLAGLVLGALPLAAATFLSSVFELVRVSGKFHLALVVAPILPAALILASYRSGCLGEPSGRGRIKRGVVVLGAGLLLIPAVFAAMTPFVLRAGIKGGWPQGAASTADRAVVLGGARHNGGWMIDTAGQRRIRFLAPPVRSAVWNADGSMLATIHQAGPLGSIGRPVLEWRDPAGRSLGSLVLEQDPDSYARAVHWAGDRMLVREWVGGHGRIRVVDPARGEIGLIDVPGDGGRSWRLIGPTDDGSIFLHRLVAQDPRVYELNRIDLEAFRLDEPLLVEDGDLPTYALRYLSPTGRYWARVIVADKVFTSYVIDLHTGQRSDYPGALVAGWLSGDRLVRLEQRTDGIRLVVQQGVGEEILSRTFAGRIGAKVSPDAQRFLVTRLTLDEQFYTYPYFVSVQTTGLEQLFVCDGRDWTDLSSLVERLQASETWLAWGGPNTLIATNGLATAVAEARPGASWKTLIGDWP